MLKKTCLHKDHRIVPIISIEGNIAAGKSTLIEMIVRNPDSIMPKNIRTITIPEPVESYQRFKYQNVSEEFNPLTLMYQSPSKNAVIAQIHFISVINESVEHSLNQILTRGSDSSAFLLVTERSLYSPKMFIQTQKEAGNINDFTRDRLFYETKICAERTIKSKAKYIGTFYIKTPVDCCFERIKSRHRQGESLISKSYLNTLHKLHEKEFQKPYYENVDLEIIDGSKNKYLIFNEFVNYAAKVLSKYYYCCDFTNYYSNT